MVTCQVVTTASETPIALAPAHRRDEKHLICPGCYLAIVNCRRRGKPRTFRVTATHQSWILWNEEPLPSKDTNVVYMKWVSGQPIN